MKEKSLFKWIAANAIGLGVGFVAILQTFMLIEFGFDWEQHWTWDEKARSQAAWEYAGLLLSAVVGGAILGSAQAYILRSQNVPILGWILVTAAGFGLAAATIVWPLIALGLFGAIPGPAEPIIWTVGGGGLAGVLQYLALRRQGIHAPKWLIRWILGLVASLVPTALLFMSLEELGVSLSWPMELFLSAFMVAGVAAWISGKALFAAISKESDPGHGSESAV